MDPTKVSAVSTYPVLKDLIRLQQFLWFTNYSSVTAPLTTLISTKVPFQWSPAVKMTFNTLMGRFTLSPVHPMPDLQCQFMVEVDASDLGVWAVLLHFISDGGHCLGGMVALVRGSQASLPGLNRPQYTRTTKRLMSCQECKAFFSPSSISQCLADLDPVLNLTLFTASF